MKCLDLPSLAHPEHPSTSIRVHVPKSKGLTENDNYSSEYRSPAYSIVGYFAALPPPWSGLGVPQQCC